jgi:hypothetical protein
MTKSKKLFKKRKGIGGRKKKEVSDSDETIVDRQAADSDRLCQQLDSSVPSCSSASEKKLSVSRYDEIEHSSSSFVNEGNIIVDLKLLSELITKSVKCKYCNVEDSLSFFEDTSVRLGLASKLVIKCVNCDSNESIRTSRKTDNGYENNLRFVYAMRALGKGQASGDTFCAVMNLPSPPSRFQQITSILGNATKEAASESMQNAVQEAVEIEGSRDLTVAIDGSWQKRGFKSKNGVVSATTITSGKVIDVEILSKYCPTCKSEEDRERHSRTGQCSSNYSGVSGGMEVAGAVAIFQRSENLYNVRYTKYLGDGDSKGFKKVVESAPYGMTTVQKLECIGHIQKRMGARLRKLRQELKNTVLSDGKKISGRGRLTDKDIDKIQSYYGNAIRKNFSSVEEMRKAVWAIYFHSTSTDEKPAHRLCPNDNNTWCKYNKAQLSGESFSHKHSIPAAIAEVFKPIFRSLAEPQLLQKCLHGLTQNPNESFNNIIWTRIPKNVFVALRTLKCGVYDAVLTFNDGHYGRIRVIEKLGLNPGYNMVEACKRLDYKRISEANREANKIYKMAEKRRRNADDEEDDPQDPLYGGGMH